MMTNSNILKISGLVVSLSLLASCGQNNAPALDINGELIASNIVGGVNMNENLQKEAGVVGLVIVTENGTGICSGSLISKRLVLTAAHCLDQSQGAIKRIFAVFAPDISKATQAQVRSASTGKQHELFLQSAMSGSKNSWNDIALVKLSEDAPSDFKFANLPTHVQNSALKPGVKLIQAGFGRSEAARNSTQDTSGVLRKVEGIALLKKSEDGKELLMNEKTKGSCNGDSGGPAYVRSRNGKLTQIGLDSRGQSQTTCLEIGIYTNVASHLEWIKSTSAALMSNAPAAAPTPVAPVSPAPAPSTSAPISPEPNGGLI